MTKNYSFFRTLKEGIVSLLVIVFVCIGICLTYSYNFNKDRGFYEFKFGYTEDQEISLESIISEENISKVKEIKISYFTGGNISTYGYVKVEDKQISIEKNGEIYTILINTECFEELPETAKKETVAKGFLKHLTIIGFDDSLYDDTVKDGKTIKGVTTLFDNNLYEFNSVEDNNCRDKMIMWGFIGLGIGLVCGITVISLLGYKYKNKKEKENIYDNETIFKTPLHKVYWRMSIKELSNIKKLMIMALLLALTLVTKFISVPSGFGNLGLGFGLIFLSVGGLLLGPVPALIMGACSDILGFFINSNGGVFFPGYTIQAMFACFIYGLFFYRTRVNFTRVLLARVFVNFIANVIIGSICWGIISNFNVNQTIDYMLIFSLPKNIAYLIPQSILIYIVFRCVVPIADASDLIEPKIADNITIF